MRQVRNRHGLHRRAPFPPLTGTKAQAPTIPQPGLRVHGGRAARAKGRGNVHRAQASPSQRGNPGKEKAGHFHGEALPVSRKSPAALRKKRGTSPQKILAPPLGACKDYGYMGQCKLPGSYPPFTWQSADSSSSCRAGRANTSRRAGRCPSRGGQKLPAFLC